MCVFLEAKGHLSQRDITREEKTIAFNYFVMINHEGVRLFLERRRETRQGKNKAVHLWDEDEEIFFSRSGEKSRRSAWVCQPHAGTEETVIPENGTWK